MNNRLVTLMIVVMPIAGAATSSRHDPLAGRTMGEPQSCMADTFADNGPTILDNHTITYNGTGRRLWVVHPDGPCPSLRPSGTLIVNRYGTQSCAGDRFRVLEPGSVIPSASCRFGEFIPYDKPKR